jgi:aspartyl aminopeptidase
MTAAPGDRDEHVADLTDFVVASPSSFHAAAEVARRLDAAGFSRHDEATAWDASCRGYVVRDGAVIAWAVPSGAGATTPYRVVGAHTDSPGLMLKPRPGSAAHGWLQAGVEVYGGPLLNSWLDRDLELAGRVVTRDGGEHLVRTGPFLRVPQLAIHLDRQVNEGLALDPQRHMQPVYGTGDASRFDLVEHLAGLARVDDITGWELVTADTQQPARFGVDDELFVCGRMDNLTSVHAGLRALLVAADEATDHVLVLAAFDHEEIGSASRSGAQGPFLADVLTRLGAALGATAEQRMQAWAGSWCVSSDAGHAVHPNYAERHDPGNRPVPGGGPLLKLNAKQRYATDAHGRALWARACDAAGVRTQEFVSNNAIPCGSTIGPLTATRLGIRVVDVGPPLLSMHSARELAHVDDLAALALALGAFYRGA